MLLEADELSSIVPSVGWTKEMEFSWEPWEWRRRPTTLREAVAMCVERRQAMPWIGMRVKADGRVVWCQPGHNGKSEEARELEDLPAEERSELF